MTNEASIVLPVNQRFRPENSSHFKEVAKNISWLLDMPLNKCQENLARIYGYSDLHELQQVLKAPGTPGPFEPRYNYLWSNQHDIIKAHQERIYFYLFGIPDGLWRDRNCPPDTSSLVFEMGLFQEASEHRVCVEKIRNVTLYGQSFDWPLIHGWPLGLKSWLASRYTEPYDLAPGWQEALSPSGEWAIHNADIRWQRFSTGLTRLSTMFGILAPRIRPPKVKSISKVDFSALNYESGDILDSSWEEFCLIDWITQKATKASLNATEALKESIQSFVQRPSRLTASACPYVKNLKDPVAFRDQWAFENIKSSLRKNEGKAVFESNLKDGFINSLHLYSDSETVSIGDHYCGKFWELSYTYSKLIDQTDSNKKPTLQPVIHSNGSLIVPFDDDLMAMSDSDWYIGHDLTDFATEDAAVAFYKLYLKVIGVSNISSVNDRHPYSVVEIDQLFVESSVTVENLTDYFFRFLKQFDGFAVPDAYGYWSNTLNLCFEDEDENSERNQNGEYAEYIYLPKVILINIDGCGLTSIKANHANGKRVSILKNHPSKRVNPAAQLLSKMVLSATEALEVDVVIYDGLAD